jgi:acrylyl-CoA reductase (NADPH)
VRPRAGPAALPYSEPVVWRALVVRKGDRDPDGGPAPVGVAVETLDDTELGNGEVTVAVEWSGINFKDAMVAQPGNRVSRISPLVPGVDLAGRVLESSSDEHRPGDPVIVHGYDLGVAHHGGFAERARVPASWVVPLPDGLSTRDAMAIGTAGFTAFVSLRRLRHAGVEPGSGPLLVTGATGGVGSTAVALAAAEGYEVVASSGKAHEHDYLRALGATDIIGREDLAADGDRVLGAERWAGAVDCVGGPTLAAIVRTLRYGGAVAASGLTGGTALETTVYPFIVRNVSLLGVDSVATPLAERRRTWKELAAAFPRPLLADMVADEIGLEGLPDALQTVSEGLVRGRILVRPAMS